MNHIILIGFMGCGKTSVGSRLAKDMGLPFVDMDDLIREEAAWRSQKFFIGMAKDISGGWRRRRCAGWEKARNGW